MDKLEEQLAQLAEDCVVPDICSLPSTKMYKIKVDFPV